MPTFVITGTRMGIGLEHVRHLAQSPSNTIFALVRSLSTGGLSALKAIQSSGPGAVHILECDTASESSIATLPERIKAASPCTTAIDVLINNAAILHSNTQTALDLTGDALLSHMTTNVLGPSRTLAALLPLLSPDAKIANITSGLGSLKLVNNGTINAEATAYSVSKAALNMLTVHQAQQVRKLAGKEGIVVICLDPGHCKTEMGGPKAVLEPAESARGIQKVIAGLKRGDNGKFLLYNGGELPW